MQAVVILFRPGSNLVTSVEQTAEKKLADTSQRSGIR